MVYTKDGISLRGIIVGFILGVIVLSLIYFLLIRDVPKIKVEGCPVCVTPTVTPSEKLCPECPKCQMCPVCPRCPECVERPLPSRMVNQT